MLPVSSFGSWAVGYRWSGPCPSSLAALEAQKEVIQGQEQPEAEGSTGPVPEDNRPGHHPDTEQDKPDLERFRSRLTGDPGDD